jgi:membrane protein
LRVIILKKLIRRVDKYQRTHRIPGFIYAIQKKYSDDSGGYQAALLAYYGFLSLFPLLFVAGSVLQLILHSHPEIRENVIHHAVQYFPSFGEQLQSNIQASNGVGFALVVSILITLWGAKGIADVFQDSLNHLWNVPRVLRPGFPKGAIKSIGIIVLAGCGFIAVSFLSGTATSIGEKGFIFRLISIGFSISLLVLLFGGIFKISLAPSLEVRKQTYLRSSLTAAVGVQVLLVIGTFVVNRELRNLQHLYGAFALTLGLLFWLYLQARVVMYATEVGVVYQRNLWPRSLDSDNLTEADKKAYAQQPQRERAVVPEKIRVKFKNQ